MTRTSRPTTFRPRVERLEDRTVPSLLPLTGDVQINQSAVYQGSAIAQAPSGQYVVAYPTAGTNAMISARLFAADGTPLTGELQVNQDTPSQALDVTVSMNATGAFVIAWRSSLQQASNTVSVIEARRYNPTGAPLGNAFQVSQGTTGNAGPSAAMDAAGNFTIVWETDAQTVEARRYDSTGTALGNAFTLEAASALLGNAAMDAAGDLVVTWDQPSSPTSLAGTVYFQQFDPTGAPVGNPVMVDFTDHGQPSVAMDSTGKFVVAWEKGYQIFARHFDATGTPVGNAIQVDAQQTIPGNTSPALYDIAPRVACDVQSDLVVVWENAPPPSLGNVIQYYQEDGFGDGVFARSFTADGLDSGAFQLSVATYGTQAAPSVAMDGQGNFVAAHFDDGSTPGTSPGIYTRRFTQTAATGYSYDFSTDTLSISAPAGSTFVYNKVNNGYSILIEGHTTNYYYPNYAFAVNGGASLTYPYAALSHVNVNFASSGNVATLTTNDGSFFSAVVSVGNGGAAVLRYQYDAQENVVLVDFMQLSGFDSVSANLGSADFGMLMGTPGEMNSFVTAGSYSYVNSGTVFGIHYQINGAQTLYAYAAGPNDIAYQYDGSDPSTYTVSGRDYSLMTGTDHGMAFFNETVGFSTYIGLASHPGQDTAIFYDSSANDVFSGASGKSYMYSNNPDGSLAYYDEVIGFAQVYAYSFVGGTDYAYNFDPQHNHTSGFIVLT
jgi:hypothetical protein